MKSIKTVYKIGQGPSSSHTVGPFNATALFKKRYPDADRYEVTLYGSLALTGEGHGTAKSIRRVIPDAIVVFDKDSEVPHPNTMDFDAFAGGEKIGHIRVFSIGGGSIRIDGETDEDDLEIYPQKYFTQIMDLCKEENISLVEFIDRMEGASVRPYMKKVWKAMEESVERGLNAEGILPGGLDLSRKAKKLYNTISHNEGTDVTMDRLISAYSYAVCEENANEDIVVTAPTCGSCGIIPSVFYYMEHNKGFSEDEIIEALMVAGLLGNILRTNASISGAECGCQAEVGSACSMAAGGLAALYGLSIDQIEYAAEVAMEHNLGLTCDPIMGLVQIPCIERNAVAAMRAVNSVNLSQFLVGTRTISFDGIVDTMYRTGLDMDPKYKETSHGGLAQLHRLFRENYKAE